VRNKLLLIATLALAGCAPGVQRDTPEPPEPVDGYGVVAPEIDPSSAAVGLALFAGMLAMVRGRK
jgi:hypothetical protein